MHSEAFFFAVKENEPFSIRGQVYCTEGSKAQEFEIPVDPYAVSRAYDKVGICELIDSIEDFDELFD